MILGLPLFLSLFHNLAIFIVLVAVYSYVYSKLEYSNIILRHVAFGFLFGLFAISCMYARIPVAEGVIVDQRNTIVVLSGAFGGPFSAVICGFMAGSYRVYLGGSGVLAGVIGVGLSALAGMAIYLLRDKIDTFLKGLMAAICATIIILPGFMFYENFQKGWALTKTMALPYGSAIFVGLFLLGLLLVHQENRHAEEKSRQKAEEALRHSENYYRALFETSGSAMFIKENDTTISHVNSNFEKLTGYSSEEIEGKVSWTDLVHPDDLEWMKENHHLRRQDPYVAPRQSEFRLITRQKEERNVLLAVDMIPGTSRSIASCIDITQRKQAERAIENERAYLSAVIDNIQEAIVICDAEGRIIRFNETARRLHGLPEQPIPSDQWTEHFDLYKKDGVTPLPMEDIPLFRALQGERVFNAEIVVSPQNNRPYYLVCSGQALTDETGKITGAVVVMHDITERKQMEDKLIEMSFYDSLTGLYNRNFFEEEMARLSDGRYSPVGMVVCDLDGLKFINDTMGHQSGDQMLRQSADILRQNFRSSDIIARIGGDEFAILLTETDKEIVEQILQRLRQSVQDHNNTEPKIPLSLSMGYACGAGGTTDLHALFREADNRMYREKIQREESARSAILQALTGSMQARDFDTEGHCDRLQELAASLARSLSLSHDFVNDLFLLARFHDLGKVGIPDQILFKPGPLTEEEWRQMRQHCEIGHRIASSVPDLDPIADWILKHHERWDGQGYPLGLSGRNIPLPCRILAIADAYDAMTSDRPYRKAMASEEAIDELRRYAGTQFDPELVEKFIRIIEESAKG